MYILDFLVYYLFWWMLDHFDMLQLLIGNSIILRMGTTGSGSITVQSLGDKSLEKICVKLYKKNLILHFPISKAIMYYYLCTGVQGASCYSKGELHQKWPASKFLGDQAKVMEVFNSTVQHKACTEHYVITERAMSLGGRRFSSVSLAQEGHEL